MDSSSPALLLDRDGTIIRDVTRQLWDPSAVELLPGTVEGLSKLRDAGWLFFEITNQAGIGFHRYAKSDFDAVQNRMMELLAAHDIRIESVRFCPHIPGFCRCRKPAIGMWESLKEEYPWLTPAQCVMAGDKDADTGLGKNIGCRTARIDSGQYPMRLQADYTVKDLDELADSLLQESSQ